MKAEKEVRRPGLFSVWSASASASACCLLAARLLIPLRSLVLVRLCWCVAVCTVLRVCPAPLLTRLCAAALHSTAADSNLRPRPNPSASSACLHHLRSPHSQPTPLAHNMSYNSAAEDDRIRRVQVSEEAGQRQRQAAESDSATLLPPPLNLAFLFCLHRARNKRMRSRISRGKSIETVGAFRPAGCSTQKAQGAG